MKKRMVWLNPFYIGTEIDNISLWSFVKKSFGLTLGIFGTVFCLVSLFLGMRGVMDLGGYVASGGPYKIEHQAPDWIWIIPVSILSGLFFILLNFLNARKIGGIKIILFLWPALFLSLGYNFMEYAFFPPKMYSGIVISWLICGVLFILMGGLPLIFLIKAIYLFAKSHDQTVKINIIDYDAKKNLIDNRLSWSRKKISLLVFIFNVIGIISGIYFGIVFFEILVS